MSTVSMTYDQLAARFGIGAKSARNLVRRKGWRRTQGNDGAARIDHCSTRPIRSKPVSTSHIPTSCMLWEIPTHSTHGRLAGTCRQSRRKYPSIVESAIHPRAC